MEPRCKSVSFSFPIDLTSEILLRLPVKSLVRFRCVSKLWLSNTTDPYFINLFETRNSRPRLLLYYKEDDELVVSSILEHTLSLDQNSRKSSSQPTHTYRMKFPEFSEYFPPTASVHGLICFRTLTRVIVWNPSTRKFLTLPRPCKSWNIIAVFLGYDEVEAKHKVIAMSSSDRSGKVCQVITLGSAQESWRIVKTNQSHTPFVFNASGQCINGVIYFLASYTNQPQVLVIVCFDVRSEKFDAIQLPSHIQVDRLITYEGRLACVHTKDRSQKNSITLSILEDAEGKKWLSKDFIAPFWHYDQSSETSFKLIGFTHAGEFIYKPYLHRKSWCALLFDPVRNSFRRFGFKGIGDNKEERQYPIHIFPNHIDSQMSL